MNDILFSPPGFVGHLAEPNSNVAPRVAGERYEGGKLVGVLISRVVALDCAVQGSPVPVIRYIKSLKSC